MQIGRLDRRITLLSYSETRNELNESVEVFTPLNPVWTNVNPTRDSERFLNSEVISEITERFTIRYSNDVKNVDARWCLQFNGKTYRIIGAPKILGRNKYIEISATARAENV